MTYWIIYITHPSTKLFKNVVNIKKWFLAPKKLFRRKCQNFNTNYFYWLCLVYQFSCRSDFKLRYYPFFGGTCIWRYMLICTIDPQNYFKGKWTNNIIYIKTNKHSNDDMNIVVTDRCCDSVANSSPPGDQCDERDVCERGGQSAPGLGYCMLGCPHSGLYLHTHTGFCWCSCCR